MVVRASASSFRVKSEIRSSSSPSTNFTKMGPRVLQQLFYNVEGNIISNIVLS